MSPLASPQTNLAACIVVPARDERARVGACMRSLARQVEIEGAAFEVLLVDDGSIDGTSEVARRAYAEAGNSHLHVVEGPARGAGVARAYGMDIAASRLSAVGSRPGLIATTDADTTVSETWLARMLDAIARGADAVGGSLQVVGSLVADNDADRETRGARLRHDGLPGVVEHPHFSGASIGVTLEAFRHVGGMPSVAALEDAALERALIGAGLRVDRLDAVRVRTSGRTSSRAQHGLGADLRRRRWVRRRGGPRAGSDPGGSGSLGVVLVGDPAEGPGRRALASLERSRARGAVREVVLASAGTGQLAIATPVARGEAMRRAVTRVASEIVVFVDVGLGQVAAEAAGRLAARLEHYPKLGACLGVRAGIDPLTHTVARPLLSAIAPDLALLRDPLSTLLAARRGLLADLSWPVGEGAPIAILLDLHERLGIDAIAETSLADVAVADEDENATSARALAVLAAASTRGLSAESASQLGSGRLVTAAGREIDIDVSEQAPPRFDDALVGSLSRSDSDTDSAI